MKVYGITGSIACGKSTVTNYLREHGYLVIDADRISREALTIDQGCIEKIDQLFHCVHGGIVDRKALGKKVFHDAKAKKMLETHFCCNSSLNQMPPGPPPPCGPAPFPG